MSWNIADEPNRFCFYQLRASLKTPSLFLLIAVVQKRLSTPNALEYNISEHFSVLSTLDNGNFDWYQEVAALWCLCCQALSLAFSPCCADVYKETSPAHIKGFKLSPQAVAMEITLPWLVIHVWLIVFSFLCCCLYKDLIMGTFYIENKE